MSIKAVLFDLDGTLLPMDQNVFIKVYFGGIAKKLAPYGYDSQQLISAIWDGTRAMVKNDGTCLNEARFWDSFCAAFGPDARSTEPILRDYYENEFQDVRNACGFAAEAAPLIHWLKQKDLRVILATNPIFPAVATHSRIRWAGLEVSDFETVTTYENSRFCKPNPAYYQSILSDAGLKGEECVMVGNDAGEDTAAGQLGCKVFLLTDCLINNVGADISAYPHGGFAELRAFLEEIIGGTV